MLSVALSVAVTLAVTVREIDRVDVIDRDIVREYVPDRDVVPDADGVIVGVSAGVCDTDGVTETVEDNDPVRE